MPPSLPKSVLALFVVPLVTATLSISTPTQAADTLVADGKVVTYERLQDTDTPAVGFYFDSKGYRNIYLLDCPNRRFIWIKNFNLSTDQETNRAASAEWKPMNARSTVTNAVYQASCPGSRTTDSEFNFNRTQGTQGPWSWDGASAITRFPDLGVHIAVIFLPDASCDEALFAVEAGQKLPSLGFKIDRRNFGYVEPEVSQFEDRFVSGFPLSKSGLAALKHGYKLILESNLGTLRVSLRGSSASFTQAYNNCMAIHSGDTVADSATDVALADVLTPLEGWWALNNVFNCSDEDGDSQMFIGRIAWDNSGRPYISEGERFRVAFHEGNCVFTSARQQGNKIKLESRCAQESEKYSGVTRLKILSPNLLNIQIAKSGGFSRLFRCPDEENTYRFEVKPLDQEPRIGRCHMNFCSWFRVFSQEEIQSQGSSTLVNVTLLGGDSPNDWDNGDPPVTWNDEPHEVSVFCSTELPALFTEMDGSKQTTVFDFWNGIAGYQESAATIYRWICHSDSTSLSDPELAERFHYRRSPNTQITVSDPTELFNYVNNY